MPCMIGRPEPNEAAPYYFTYIDKALGDDALLTQWTGDLKRWADARLAAGDQDLLAIAGPASNAPCSRLRCISPADTNNRRRHSLDGVATP